MNVRDRQIELLTPVLRGLIVAAIHVSVCLVAAQQAATTPDGHYFAYLYIDMLQNESVLLGCFVALSSYSIVLRGIVGIFGLGVLVYLCPASTVSDRAYLLPFVMFVLTLAGGGWVIFLGFLGVTLSQATSRSCDAPRMQFTLKRLLVVSAVTCCILILLREHRHAINGVVAIPIVEVLVDISSRFVDSDTALAIVTSMLLAVPTMIVTSFAAIGFLKTTPMLTGVFCNLLIVVIPGFVVAMTSYPDIPDLFLWLAETPLHMLMAMWLFRWMGLRFNE